MSPEAQRIAIAEACGWTNFGMVTHGCIPPQYPGAIVARYGACGTVPGGNVKSVYDFTELPDYLNDLNAMRAAELVLNWDEQASTQLFNYRCALTKVCGNDLDLIPFASAWQRAEALLKTLGKWDDAK